MKKKGIKARQNTVRRLLGLALSLLMSAQAFADLNLAQRLTLSAQVWGIAKYRHPEVTACRRNWDQVLINTLPAVEAASSDAQLDIALQTMLASAGPINAVAISAAAPAWIAAAPLSASTKGSLAALAATRPARQCYVEAFATGNANFAKDAGFVNGNTDVREIRLLAAFRYWNAVEYFFGYKELIGRDWAGVLEQYVLPIADATDASAYSLHLRSFMAEVNDSHGYVSGPNVRYDLAPVQLAYLNGQAVVRRPGAELRSALMPGDVITAINDLPTAAAVQFFEPYSFGSSPSVRSGRALHMALSGRFNTALKLKTIGADGVEKTLSLRFPDPATNGFRNGIAGWQILPNRSCRVGVVTADRFTSGDGNALSKALAGLDLLVMDLREYPSLAMTNFWSAGKLPTSSNHIAYATPDFKNPGAYLSRPLNIGGAPRFNGRIVVVLERNAISQSEFLAMLLQGWPRTLVVGNQSAGADGEVSLNLSLPGGFTGVQFTSNRVAYADGRASQRYGIVPDVHVVPTVAGLRAGLDEVLDTASDCRWVRENPAPRGPQTALYSVEQRISEGLAMIKSANGYLANLYLYDSLGFPIVRSSTSAVSGGVWDVPTEHNGMSNAAARLKLDFQRGPYSPECASFDQARVPNRASLAWPLEAPTKLLCIESFFSADSSSHNGLWQGTVTASGVQLGIHENAGVLVTYLHAPDATGTMRWMIGVSRLDAEGKTKLEMLRIKGNCDTCTNMPVTTEVAGSLELRFNGPDSARIKLDVQFHDGSKLLLEDAELIRNAL